jgi:hypothetical protein
VFQRNILRAEDGDSMFLRTVGIYFWVYAASKSRATSSSSCHMCSLVFQVWCYRIISIFSEGDMFPDEIPGNRFTFFSVVDVVLMDYDAMWTHVSLSIQWHNSEEQYQHLHCCENLKSHIFLCCPLHIEVYCVIAMMEQVVYCVSSHWSFT